MLQLTIEQATLIALQHHQAGRFDLAEEIYRKILAHEPDHPEVYFNLGNALVEKGTLSDGLAAYQQAIRLKPDYSQAYNNLGIALARAGQYEQAAAAYQQAAAIDPAAPQTYNNLGSALKHLERFDEAIEAYSRAIHLNSDYADAYNNLGNLLVKRGVPEQAIPAYREALRLVPQDPETMNNLGVALKDAAKYKDAIALFEQTSQLKSDWAYPRWNLATTLLMTGDFERGWAEYEWRWKWNEFTSPRREFPQPQWAGEKLTGKTILLHGEQGLGDTIQFVRYAPKVARRVGHVVLACDPSLARLLHGVPGVEKVISDEAFGAFDVHCPLLSLPLLFKTRLETIPADVPYLMADGDLVEAWEKKIGSSPARLKVGLVWAGTATHANDRNRSMPLSQLAALGRVSGVRYYSLQKGPGALQAAHPPAGLDLIDLTDALTDFADTAALMSHLDLVITVDTAVAHLAGAMGKTTWLLLPLRADWRWLVNRDDSPWYPTMRLFRQKRAGDWEEVIQRVSEVLSGMGGPPMSS